MTSGATSRDWPGILSHAATLVHSYDTGVTLRQLFYRLVADGTLPNTTNAYKSLSRYTAEARRAEAFPTLIDPTRVILQDKTFTSPEAARAWLGAIYQRDRTEGQPVALYLAVEKAGIVAQLSAWFGDDYGFPILAVRGYGSQSYMDQITTDVSQQGRPAVLLYAGDFDPSGEDIDRDLLARTGGWSAVRRVALTAEQVDAYQLPEHPGKADDSRAAAFERRHGRLVQVELDALPPDTLRDLFTKAIGEFWEPEPWHAVCAREAADRAALAGGGA